MTLVLECNPLPDMSDDCIRAEHERIDVITFDVSFVDEIEKMEEDKINSPKFQIKKNFTDIWILSMRNTWANILFNYFKKFQAKDFNHDAVPRPLCAMQSSTDYIQKSDYCQELFELHFEEKIQRKDYECNLDITFLDVIDTLKGLVLEMIQKENNKLSNADGKPREKIIAYSWNTDLKVSSEKTHSSLVRKRIVVMTIPNWRNNKVVNFIADSK